MSEHRDPKPGMAPDATVQLLQAAGPRAPVPPLRAARVRAAVRASWLQRRARRAGRRRALAGVLLLGAAAALLIAVMPLPIGERAAAPAIVAHVARVEGRAPLQTGDPVRAGDWVATSTAARAALQFADGTSVRLDEESRVRVRSAQEIELAAGAVYVDTGDTGGRFLVRTPLAAARDVGTQFEVRLIGDDTLRLRVRTGIVELTDRGRAISGRAGTEIVLSPAEAASRPIAPHDAAWEWASRLAPAAAMEGASLAQYLRHLAREQGWLVDYADPALAREAETIVLHGAVDGLAPLERVDVAVAASGLRHRVEGGTLLVLRAGPHGALETTPP